MANNRVGTTVDATISRFTGYFTRRLRDQIVVPYLLLATVLAVTGTYLLVSAASQSLHERFNSQLLDAAQGGADSLAQTESQHLAGLRAIIFTQGFAEALAKRDAGTMATLAGPQALNYEFDRVLVMATDGTTLLTLPRSQTGSSTTSTAADLNALAPSALRPSGELAKLSAVVDMPQGRVFFTAGPVRQDDKDLGVVLVGTTMSRLLGLMARDSLSDGVNMYGASGAPLGNTLVATGSPQGEVAPLPPSWYDEIRADATAKVRFRTVTVSGQTYVEALGMVPGRGYEDQSPGVFGVMLRTRTLDAKLQQTLVALLPIFALGLLLIFLLGSALAASIDRPVAQLVRASNYVAQGNLEVQVPATRRDELGVLARRFNDMVGGLQQLLFVKDLFGRFVSPEVSERLLAGQIELGGEQREVTVLFSDIRDFTRLSEEHSASDIVDLLNEYFRAVVAAARKHGGIVNKFGGDSTLVVFGAPLDMPNHADSALATALELRQALDAINAHRVLEGWELLAQGIGVNTGQVIAGQVGSEDRMEYTVIGDTVNLASRLQVLSKDLTGCDIIFSESTLAALSDQSGWRYRDRGSVAVRGKQQGIRVFSLEEAVPFDSAPPPGTHPGRNGNSPDAEESAAPVLATTR
jgi:class 3 adenylate cyclase